MSYLPRPQIVFKANKTGSQSVTNGVDTRIEFNSEVIDTFGLYDPTTNFRFTADRTGIYQFRISIIVDAMAADKAFSVYVKKNGATTSFAKTSTSIVGSSQIDVSGIVEMVATDYVEAWVTQNDTVPRNLSTSISGTFFDGFIIN